VSDADHSADGDQPTDADLKPDTRHQRAPGRPRRQLMALARAGHLEYDRILFFSDAVFAIAITLLIVDLPVGIDRALAQNPLDASATALRHAVPGIEGFGISFVVIGLFWVGHHGLFRYVRAFDRRLMLLNLLFLGIIAFLPYPTAVLSSVSNNEKPAVVFYAACAGAAGLVETLVWLYATRPSVSLVADLSPESRRLFLLRTSRVPAVFAGSIVIAQFSARAAMYSWLAIWVTGVAINRYYGHHEPEAADPDAADTAAAA
jgi:uncharacterized membrane protein